MSEGLCFIGINDVHWRGSNPPARLDVYEDAIAAKLLEVFHLAKEFGAAGILIAGDLTDSPNISLSSLAKLAQLLSQAPCPIYAIAGQHDMYGHNPATLYRTPYGLLRTLGIIKDLHQEDAYIESGGTTVLLSGHSWDGNADRGNMIPQYSISPTGRECVGAEWNIHLAHGTLLQQSPGFEMRHTLVSDIQTASDVVLVGDYHPGIGIQKVKRTIQDGRASYVVNMGALGRLKASTSDMERTVSAVYIGCKPGKKGAIINPIDLRSARPGEEVLSREHIEVQEQRSENMEVFLSLIAEEALRGESLETIIESISGQERLPQTVTQRALSLIGEAREALGR